MSKRKLLVRSVIALCVIACGLWLVRRDAIGPPLPPGKVRPQLAGAWLDLVPLAPDGTLWQWGEDLGSPPENSTMSRWCSAVSALCVKLKHRPLYAEPTNQRRYFRAAKIWALPSEVASRRQVACVLWPAEVCRETGVDFRVQPANMSP